MMNEIVEPIVRGLPQPGPVAKRLAMPLALSAVAIGAVLPALLDAHASADKIALPIFLAGAAASFGVALYDFARGRQLRFARALLAGAALWSLSALATSPEPALYAVGRVSQWLVELAVMYLLLSYPSGRLTKPAHWALFWSGALLVMLLYLPTALIAQHYPMPSPWAMCSVGCPHNPFALGNSTPALVNDLIVPVRELLTVLVLIGVAAAAIQRWRNSGALLGRMCATIALISVVQPVALAAYFRLRAVDPTAGGLDVLSWIYVLSLPGVALAAGAGRLYRRMFAAKALDRIAEGLSTSATPARVERVVADALEDPSLQVLHSFPGDAGRWIDASGALHPTPLGEPERSVTEVENGTWRLAIVHDRELEEDPTLVHTAGSYALAALENDRLSDELRSSFEQLDDARRRSITAERRERRKIEREIHDGAQQRLVALRIKLTLTAEQLGAPDGSGGKALRALQDDIDATIEEVRSFARGIYPSLLAETGLASALKALARGTSIPTTVTDERLGRYSRDVEMTVYFSCSEALQNAAKHAHDAKCVTLRAWDDGNLNFEVSDDGHGFDLANTPSGTGLSGLKDRLAAVGGNIRIQSAPGHGTTVTGSIPPSRGALPPLSTSL